MIKLLHNLFADKRIAFGIFRSFHELTERDDGHAPQHKRDHFDKNVVVQLCVGTNERPIDVEEVLVDELVSVA